MIFYFTGTGNSLYAAKTVAEAQGERLVSIAERMRAPASRRFELEPGELLGFVFPVYAWAPPEIVLDFVESLEVSGEAPYVFSICTCGDEEGRTTKRLARALASKGLELSCAFTLPMPNNYVVGFDVDPDDVAREKLADAKTTLGTINTVLAERKRNVFQLIPGSMPDLKSGLVNPLFNRFARGTKPFFATDACTACGLCERICPRGCIVVKEKPAWSGACLQCLACLHRCPERAIQYGKGTMRKGRYAHPDIQADRSPSSAATSVPPKQSREN